MTLISDVNGRITSLKFDDGTYVNAGSVLLTVDNELIRNELDLTEINLGKRKKTLQRLGICSKERRDRDAVRGSQMGLDNLKVKLKSLKNS